MTILLYILLIALCFAILIDGMIHPERVYQFPFGAAAVFGGFIVPPLFGLLRAHYLPDGAAARYIFMCLLCLLMCWLGDAWARTRLRTAHVQHLYESSRWLTGAAILILVGGAAYAKFRSLFAMDFAMNTGVTVAIGFFVVLVRYGFVMSLIHWLSTRSQYAFCLVCLATAYYLDRIVFFGRRRDLIEFVFVIVCSVWFALGKALPRVAVITGVIITTLAIGSVGAYRNVVVQPTGERDWSRLREVNLVGHFQSTAMEGSTETISGIYLMAASARDKAFDYGLYHWNALVFNYVPAQVFGGDFKASLNLELPDLVSIAQREFGFTPSTGTTVTGMVDCYASFWYVGCLKFLLIAYIMQRLYQYAMDGEVAAQAVYLLMLCMGLHAITHHTHWYLSPWVHMLFFWFPLIIYARVSVDHAGALACEYPDYAS